MRKTLLFVLLCLASTAVLGQPGPGPGGPPLPPPLAPPVEPAGNPGTAARVMLGTALYWDEQLSSTNTIACATCHQFTAGGVDPRSAIGTTTHPGADGLPGTRDDVTGSPGVPQTCEDGGIVWTEESGFAIQVTGRSTPPAINAGYADALFWDGRAADALVDPLSGETLLASGAALEVQALGPILSSVEMGYAGRDWADVINKLDGAAPLALAPSIPGELATWIGSRDYEQLFAEAFGDVAITPARIAMAIAAYERSLLANETPFDAFLGGDDNALTQQEQRGLNVFRTAGCQACHAGSETTDHAFRYIGLAPVEDDLGRFDVTGQNGDRGRFKTSDLRNLSLRAPFMHNGAFGTIAEVIDFYDRGGDFSAPNLDPRIRPRGLSNGQKADLEAFLMGGLTDPRVASAIGPFAHPELSAEEEASVTVGIGGIGGRFGVPAVLVIGPALAGTDRFVIGVDGVPDATPVRFVVAPDDPGTVLADAEAGARWVVTTTARSADVGTGYASVSLPLPHDGAPLVGRWFVDDDAAPAGIAVSAPVTIAPLAPAGGRSARLFAGDFEAGSGNCGVPVSLR
ncbi:MAG: cytochrome c peroxidase [Pseudomonadota bacterium]